MKKKVLQTNLPLREKYMENRTLGWREGSEYKETTILQNPAIGRGFHKTTKVETSILIRLIK